MKKLLQFLPFWLFMVLFKFAGGLHYSLLSTLGERIMPLWLVGLTVGGSALGQMLLDIKAGSLLDRFGYKRLLQLTTALFALAGMSLAFGLTTATYLLSVFGSTFGWLFFGPGVNAYILSQAPSGGTGKFISLRDVSGSAGLVISCAVLPVVIALAPHQIGILLVIAFMCAFAAVSLSPTDSKAMRERSASRVQTYAQTLAAVRRMNPASTVLLLLNFVAAMFYGTIWFVVPLVISQQAHAGLLGWGLGVFDFTVVVLGFSLGTLADKIDRRTLVFFGLLLFACSVALLGWNFGWLFLLFGFLATTGDEMAGVSLWSWLHSLDHEHAHDGTLAGVLNVGEDFGWTVGPAWAGFAYGLVGPSWSIALAAVPIAFTLCIFLVMSKNRGLTSVAPTSRPRKPHKRRHRG